MHKKNIFVLIPLFLVSALLGYCGVMLLLNKNVPEWRHFTGLFLFLPVVYGYIKKSRWAVVYLGVYLLAGTFNALALTPEISTHWLTISSEGLRTPPIQLVSLGLLILWFVVNVDVIIALELDYKAARKQKSGK